MGSRATSTSASRMARSSEAGIGDAPTNMLTEGGKGVSANKNSNLCLGRYTYWLLRGEQRIIWTALCLLCGLRSAGDESVNGIDKNGGNSLLSTLIIYTLPSLARTARQTRRRKEARRKGTLNQVPPKIVGNQCIFSPEPNFSLPVCILVTIFGKY
jgi:hypothetical protein